MSLVLCYAAVVLVLVLVLSQSCRSCALRWQLVAAAVRSNGSWWQQLFAVMAAVAAAVRSNGVEVYELSCNRDYCKLRPLGHSQ